KKRAEQIKYSFEIQGNKLVFDDYLIAEIKDKYRNQSIKVHIYIPENKVFYIDEESKRWYSFESNGRYRDRKSTRLNSSHVKISYAVFCLKKKKNTKKIHSKSIQNIKSYTLCVLSR